MAAQGVHAQDRPATCTLQGQVRSAEGHESLPGVRIYIPGTSWGTLSNPNGYFELKDLPPGDVQLVASCLGYAADTVVLILQPGAREDFVMELEAARLEIPAIEIQAGMPAPEALLNRLDLQHRPVNHAQELLRLVPGLFIAQHAGGGKAEQIFLRGFDIDHGTDLALTTDGMPVNLVSHAHGQGYADLHYLIPETVDALEVHKGPYTAAAGNFATAGSLNFTTLPALGENMFRLEGSMYDQYRAVGMFRLSKGTAPAPAWVAAEYQYANGWYASPQHLNRLNLFGKWRKDLSPRQQLTLIASGFRSSWDASGQIPERAVAQGLITRFGSIDPTEGGMTQRANVQVLHQYRRSPAWNWQQQAWAGANLFRLYSNFTFYAADSLRGDQILQAENRVLGGYTSRLRWTHKLLGQVCTLEQGLGFRADEIRDNMLARTQQRQWIAPVQRGDVYEQNVFGWLELQQALGARTELRMHLREDYLRFTYADALDAGRARRSTGRAVFSPGVHLNYRVSSRLETFVKAGSGFHSNDARVLTAGQVREILPRALGADLGALCKPLPGLLVQVTLWGLRMQQEFVYVGDAGITEPGGRSRRVGLDLSARWQAGNHLLLDADLNLAHARGLAADGSREYIPLAPQCTSTGGLLWLPGAAWKASLRYRWLSDRPADETASLVATGYFLLDASLSRSLGKHFTAGISVQNLLNQEWKEAQFATTSRLQQEAAPVTEIHFTPGSPRCLKLQVTCTF